MDTYGDMVTAIRRKWEVFVNSLSPEASKQAEEIAVNSPVGESTQELTGTQSYLRWTMDTDTLYLVLSQKMDEMGIDA